MEAYKAVRSRSLAILIISALVYVASFSEQARAQDLSLNLADQFGRSIFTGAAQPMLDLSHSDSPLSGLSITGLLSNTSGMWASSAELTNFGRAAGEHHGANSLSVERNWIQADSNYVLDGNNKFFVRFWGVYEPPYPWESTNILSEQQVYDKSQSQFYNQYTVRDAFWKNTTGPLTLFLGRQIVTWGESLSFRVGDVINPQDLSWNFGFANLEQSRLPLWMVHPILNLPKAGPFTDNFIEGVWAPAWQPMYTNVDYADNRYAGLHSIAGSVNLQPPGGARFDTYPYPFTTPAQTPPGMQAAFPQVTNLVSQVQTYRLPSDTWANSVEGFRLHTLVEDAEITALYWHGHQLNNTMFVNGTPQIGQTFQFRYPELNDVGITLNRPIYIPVGALANVPFVLRTEGVWQDRTPFNTLNTARPSAVVYSSTLNTLAALDVDGLATPWLSRTGALTLNLEWNNYTILSPNKDLVYGGYAEHWRHNEENLLFSASTSWWWGAVVPTPTAIFNPDGNTWEFFPNIVLTPPWTNKYLLMLEFIGVLSNDKYSAYAGGNFKGKNILLMQFQYNFDLVRGRN
ncbi:MAG TPA: DUF1302 family protein [Candidatus Binataceae bacterium]|nr:DUF1302 family protein [Candidatus Binataceae bacterium]